MEIIVVLAILGWLFAKPETGGHYHIVNGETVYCKHPKYNCQLCRPENYAKYDVLM